MAIRVNGGVFADQVLTGDLTHYRVLGADFSGAYSDGTYSIPNGAGPGIPFVIPLGEPVPNSAAEEILIMIETKATIVIMNPDVDGCGLHFAIENTDNGWVSALEIEFAIQSLGSDVGVDHVDCIPCNVEIVPYLLGDPCAVCSSTFLDLEDTPAEYTGAAGMCVAVNAAGDALEFVACGGGGSGEANTASNLGTGDGIFAQKLGVDLQFKSLVAGTNVTLTSSATEITIDATGGVAPVTSVFGRTGVVVATEGDYVIDEMGDVDTTTTPPTVGQVLEWDGSDWVPATPASHVTKVTTINGQPMLTLDDTTRGNKTLSIAEQPITFSENRLADLDWINIGNATDADSGYIADFDGTVTSVTAHCENTGANSKDIELHIDGVNQGTIATLAGGANVTDQDQTLNIDFTQGQRIRLRAIDGIAGNIQDTVIKLTLKWRG